MWMLVLGLLIFLGLHSARIVADDWRTRAIGDRPVTMRVSCAARARSVGRTPARQPVVPPSSPSAPQPAAVVGAPMLRPPTQRSPPRGA